MDNPIPGSSLNSDETVVALTTKREKPFFVHANKKYHKKKTNDDQTIRWTCVNRECSASIYHNK